jgi:hypothetical protein
MVWYFVIGLGLTDHGVVPVPGHTGLGPGKGSAENVKIKYITHNLYVHIFQYSVDTYYYSNSTF